MRLSGKLPAILAMCLFAATTPVLGQGGTGSNPYYDYNSSTLMQGNAQQNIYYPYWNNYLDNLQQEGGYQAVHGNYPNSAPVTSYYPSAQDSRATTPQAAQPQMYSNSGYYSNYGQAQPGYGAQAAQYGAYGAQQAQQAQPNYGAAPAPQRAPQSNSPLQASTNTGQANPGQANQGPVEDPVPTPQEIAAEQQRFLYLSGRNAEQDAVSAAMAQAEAQARAQGQAYGAQYGAQPGQQASAAPQGYPSGQQAYMNNAAATNQAADDLAFSADPNVRRAQEEARLRAEARRKAAEQAAQQQAAMQELQQAQTLYEQAQARLQEEEQKQKALQAEFHRRAVSDAYDSLRMAQQRYYDLMGVEGEAGPPQSNYGQQAAAAPNPMAVTTNPSYGQPAAPQQQPMQPVQPQVAPQPQRPAQATPLYAGQAGQQGQSNSSNEGGILSSIKSFFSPPAGGVNQRALLDRQKRSREMNY